MERGPFKHLDLSQRRRIESGLNQQEALAEIARTIGVDVSLLADERDGPGVEHGVPEGVGRGRCRYHGDLHRLLVMRRRTATAGDLPDADGHTG